MYLTNEQYLEILNVIEKELNKNINPNIFDNDTIGNKYTNSNIGFCNDNFTTYETALFPDDFLKFNRKTLKYRLKPHACPFDNRVRNLYEKEEDTSINLGSGCFYTCCLNNNKLSNQELKEYVKDTREKFLKNKF